MPMPNNHRSVLSPLAHHLSTLLFTLLEGSIEIWNLSQKGRPTLLSPSQSQQGSVFSSMSPPSSDLPPEASTPPSYYTSPFSQVDPKPTPSYMSAAPVSYFRKVCTPTYIPNLSCQFSDRRIWRQLLPFYHHGPTTLHLAMKWDVQYDILFSCSSNRIAYFCLSIVIRCWFFIITHSYMQFHTTKHIVQWKNRQRQSAHNMRTNGHFTSFMGNWQCCCGVALTPQYISYSR